MDTPQIDWLDTRPWRCPSFVLIGINILNLLSLLHVISCRFLLSGVCTYSRIQLWVLLYKDVLLSKGYVVWAIRYGYMRDKPLVALKHISSNGISFSIITAHILELSVTAAALMFRMLKNDFWVWSRTSMTLALFSTHIIFVFRYHKPLVRNFRLHRKLYGKMRNETHLEPENPELWRPICCRSQLRTCVESLRTDIPTISTILQILFYTISVVVCLTALLQIVLLTAYVTSELQGNKSLLRTPMICIVSTGSFVFKLVKNGMSGAVKDEKLSNIQHFIAFTFCHCIGDIILHICLISMYNIFDNQLFLVAITAWIFRFGLTSVILCLANQLYVQKGRKREFLRSSRSKYVLNDEDWTVLDDLENDEQKIIRLP